LKISFDSPGSTFRGDARTEAAWSLETYVAGLSLAEPGRREYSRGRSLTQGGREDTMGIMETFGKAGKDILYYGKGKPPEKGAVRRAVVKGLAAGVVAAGAWKGLKYLEWLSNSAANPENWQTIVGGKENPHPELGRLIWQGAFMVKPGAEFHQFPTWRRTEAEPPYASYVEGNPVVYKMDDTVMKVHNALLFAQEAWPGEKNIAEVKPTEGDPYTISLDTVHFAVDLPESPTGVGWLSLDDVRFLDDNDRVLNSPPLDRIIQAPIGGNEPWKGMADIAGTPLHVGLVKR
jgi:hypothetical protein